MVKLIASYRELVNSLIDKINVIHKTNIQKKVIFKIKTKAGLVFDTDYYFSDKGLHAIHLNQDNLVPDTLNELLLNNLVIIEADVQKNPTSYELKILESIDMDFKYIARDKDNTLNIFRDKPEIQNDNSYWSGDWDYPTSEFPFRNLFEGITFDNSPVLISDYLSKYKEGINE